MENKISKEFLNSPYRKEMWKNVRRVVKKIEKVIPVSEMYMTGSFTSRKKRPADIDFMVLLHTPANKKKNWSVDLVIVPDNKHGKAILKDNLKWVRQRYGAKSGHIKWK